MFLFYPNDYMLYLLLLYPLEIKQFRVDYSCRAHSRKLARRITSCSQMAIWL